eukprot:2273447-Rhodomonas_salina.3
MGAPRRERCVVCGADPRWGPTCSDPTCPADPAGPAETICPRADTITDDNCWPSVPHGCAHDAYLLGATAAQTCKSLTQHDTPTT